MAREPASPRAFHSSSQQSVCKESVGPHPSAPLSPSEAVAATMPSAQGIVLGAMLAAAGAVAVHNKLDQRRLEKEEVERAQETRRREAECVNGLAVPRRRSLLPLTRHCRIPQWQQHIPCARLCPAVVCVDQCPCADWRPARRPASVFVRAFPPYPWSISGVRGLARCRLSVGVLVFVFVVCAGSGSAMSATAFSTARRTRSFRCV